MPRTGATSGLGCEPRRRRAKPLTTGPSALRGNVNDESGFSLIEVVVALVVLAMVMAASTGLISTAMQVGQSSRLRQLATDIASSSLDCAVASINLPSGSSAFPTSCGEEQSLLSAQGYSGLLSVDALNPVVRGGTTFTVEQEVTAGNGACALPAGGAPPELQVTDWVTWAPNVAASSRWWQGGVQGRYVEESTIVAVPAAALNSSDGNILVKITDDDPTPNGQNGVEVTVSGQNPVYTSQEGCVLFANLTPGSYSITATEAGWIDSNNDYSSGAPAPLSMSGTVTAGNTLVLPNAAPNYYAQEATVTANYTVSAPYTVPTGTSSLPLSFYNTSLSTDPSVLPAPSGPGDDVFPFPGTSYQVVSGSCVVAGTPGAPDTPDGSATTDGQPVSVTAGSSAAVTFSLSPVAIVVYDTSGQLSGATVTAQASTSGGGSDSNCPSSGSTAMPQLSFPATSNAGLTAAVKGVDGPFVLASFLRTVDGGKGEGPGLGRAREYVLTATTSLSASPSTSVYTQQVTFTVVGMSSKYVKFTDGATLLGCAQATGSPWTWSTTSIPVGSSQTITATPYPSSGCTGSAGTAASASVTVSTNTSTAVTSSMSPAKVGDSITFTAVVSPVSPVSGTPTGTVTFKNNGTAISGCSSVSLSSGTATCTTTALTASTPTSTNSITAVFAPTGTWSASTSAALAQTMLQYASLSGLPYGYWIIGAKSSSGTEKSTSSGSAVVLQVAATGVSECTYTGGTYNVATGYYTGGSCSGGWQSVSTGSPIYVKVQ